jgi:hypothetical protein
VRLFRDGRKLQQSVDPDRKLEDHQQSATSVSRAGIFQRHACRANHAYAFSDKLRSRLCNCAGSASSLKIFSPSIIPLYNLSGVVIDSSLETKLGRRIRGRGMFSFCGGLKLVRVGDIGSDEFGGLAYSCLQRVRQHEDIEMLSPTRGVTLKACSRRATTYIIASGLCNQNDQNLTFSNESLYPSIFHL